MEETKKEKKMIKSNIVIVPDLSYNIFRTIFQC